MCKVMVGERTLTARKGERLMELLVRYGIESPHPCGGRGSCEKCRVLVDGREALSCRYVIEGDVTVTLTAASEIEVTLIEGDCEPLGEGAFFALDVGTTTLCLSLVSGEGRELCRVSAQNPQTVFGADVISRIGQCERSGAESLRRPLIEKINKMISAAKAAVGSREPCVRSIYAAGNTTMLHLLLGVDCSGIGRSPYTPVFLEEKEVSAADAGICGIEKLILLPSAHSFVGADVMAGLSLIELGEGYSIFVDLGTNAEIVLASKDRILCTAAAAGPCFEGSNIDCGMSALSGAVCSVDIDESGIRLETVGGGKPKGICATGLVDAVYSLLKTDVIDEGGYMEGNFYLSDGVYLSPRDIRNFQLAKSAVHSAIEALLSRADVGFDRVDALYISGGFSGKLSPMRAAAVGLIPLRLSGKCRVIADSCLMGEIKYAMGDRGAVSLAERAEYCDLSADGVFVTKFIENMSFEI